MICISYGNQCTLVFQLYVLIRNPGLAMVEESVQPQASAHARMDTEEMNAKVSF